MHILKLLSFCRSCSRKETILKEKVEESNVSEKENLILWIIVKHFKIDQIWVKKISGNNLFVEPM